MYKSWKRSSSSYEGIAESWQDISVSGITLILCSRSLYLPLDEAEAKLRLPNSHKLAATLWFRKCDVFPPLDWTAKTNYRKNINLFNNEMIIFK